VRRLNTNGSGSIVLNAGRLAKIKRRPPVQACSVEISDESGVGGAPWARQFHEMSEGGSTIEPSKQEIPQGVFELVHRHVGTLVGLGAPNYDVIVAAALDRIHRDFPGFRSEAGLSSWVFRACYAALLEHSDASSTTE
jgi:hypothetical protein